MSPYPTAQMHAAQKRGMYPMNHHHQMAPAQNMGPNQMYQQHNQQNYGPVPSPMHQNYIRPGGNTMAAAAAANNSLNNSYLRVPSTGMMPQQRPGKYIHYILEILSAALKQQNKKRIFQTRTQRQKID